MKRCQGARGGGDVGSGTGSLSRAESGPGSSGACTSAITGSTGFGLAADFADLRGAGSGLACGTGGATAIGAAAGRSGGGATSITGRVTPISASGSFHAKPSSRPFGDTGSQRSDTTPSAVHTGSPAARMARPIHSRTRPSSPCSLSSISAIRVATRRVGAERYGASGARDGQRAFELARHLGGQLLHAGEAVARAVAEPQVGIGFGNVGMRIDRPRLLQDLTRL